MSPDRHEPWAEAVGSYVLGALPEDERADFERHLETCERCRDEAASLQVAVDALPVAVPPVDPPGELKARIMGVVESEAELLQAAGTGADRPRPRRRGLRGLFPRPIITAVAAAAALAVGVVGGIVIVGHDDGGGGARTLAASVFDPVAKRGARAAVVVDGTEAKLIVHGMPAPGPGRVWQVWVKREGSAPDPAGALFEVGSGEVTIPRSVHRGDRILVTSEPDRGSPAPTRPPVVVAQPV